MLHSTTTFFQCFALIAIFVWSSVAANPISVESCRQQGFDPFQLSCSVCEILPESVTESCKSCCLPYKTLEKRNRRFQYAVLMAPDANVYGEISTLLEEDLERIHNEKGSDRFLVKRISGGGGMYRMPPAAIFWFDEAPPSTSSDVFELEEKAVETIFLDQGWKRDDMRDMLLALLPDN
jgi:hypothetical protein